MKTRASLKYFVNGCRSVFLSRGVENYLQLTQIALDMSARCLLLSWLYWSR